MSLRLFHARLHTRNASSLANYRFDPTLHLNVHDLHYNIITPVTSHYAPMAPTPAAPNMLSTKVPTPVQADPLEQRILDLLFPYRDECFEDEDESTELKERAALILCGMFLTDFTVARPTKTDPENITFLIRHHQTTYGKHVEANDVNLASRNWSIMKHGAGRMAGVSIFVNGGTGFTHTVIRVNVKPGESVVECFEAQVNLCLEEFFPGI